MLATSAGEVADYLLAFFLLVVGLGLGYALFRLAGVFQRLSSLIAGTEREALPVVNKAGGTIDRVNGQLDKLDPATDSAVDAVIAIDQAVRALSFSVRRPIELIVGATTGVSHGWATFVAKRDWRSAVESAKEASARRRADFEEELRHTETGV
jgi:uncharacterized protein YoxC